MLSDCEKSKNYIMIENFIGYRVYLLLFCMFLLIFSKILFFYIFKIFLDLFMELNKVLIKELNI